MKRIFSTVLALMLILSSFSFTAMNVFAADGEIAIQAATLNNVLSSDGVKAAAKATLLQGDDAPDGITAVKVNPDPCEDRDPVWNVECKVTLECYPTDLGITPASYKYARLTYKYVPAEDDANTYSPTIEFRTKALGFKSYSSPDALKENQWATVDFEISGTEYAADDIISQLRVNAFGNALGTLDYKGGSYNADSVTLADPDSTLYIANLAFFTEKPGVPTITGISFASESVTVTRGTSVNVPNVTVTGTSSPITSYDLLLAGHTSADTKLSADGTMLMVGEDEEADTITLTATSVADPAFSATLTINVEDPKPRSTFDADNVVMSFGVVSDIHLSGSWNQPRSKAKWSHVIDVFQSLGADAILMNGDLTDAIASAGNVSGNGLHTDKNGNGTKADQNFREVGYVAQAMWGASDGGYGNGTNDTTKMFWVLGNHDEGGEGVYNGSSSRQFTKVYSAEYVAAVVCGWQYDNTSEAALASPDGMEDSYRSYIADLLDYNTNSATTVTAETFESAYGVTLASADAKFDKFIGFDSDYSLKDEYGLFYGNRHMTLDPDGVKDDDLTDDIHFIGIELSQSNNSIAWAETIIKQSITENPNKPIFVITHYKTAGTSLIGSQYQSITRLGDLLSKYPQTFVWGGHNHTYLHSDRAIDTSNGYVSTDSAVTAYASQYNLTNGDGFGKTGDTSKLAVNANSKENHAYGNGAFVQVDKNNNVRINRVDLYRSFSADYAENTALFSTAEFTDFANQASFTPVDEAVFIRTPWDVTDIGPEGTHLQDYTKARFEESETPVFKSNTLTATSGKIGAIPVKFTMNATDDGMVYMYLLELTAKDSTDVLQRYYFTNKFYNYPDANIPVIEAEYTFTGLSPNTTYTVHLTPVDDFMNKGAALTADATTLNGDTKVTLEDGTIAVFVDTTGENTLYTWTDGKDYLVYSTMSEAVAAQADIIYVIKCDSKLYFQESDGSYTNEFKNMKAGAKIIGLDRDNAIIRYNASYTLVSDHWFENVQISREGPSDCGITLNGKTLTLVDVKGMTKDLNLFNTGWGSSDKSGTFVIKGDTGYVESIFPGPNFGANAGSKGDVNIILEGGTYGNVGNVKAQSGNKIDGNVFITVTGGTYDTLRASHTSANHKITKNAVLKIFGGNFTTVGIAGTTNVDGKDVMIMTNVVKASIPTLNKADNQIIITVPDNATDAVGDATFDASGYITGFAVKQIDGKKSFVNGEAATSFTVENGKEYEITYKTPNALEFDLNGGEGDVPATITGNAGDDVTSQMPDGTGVTKENHTFLGWSVDKNAVAPDTSFVISADGTVVYAVWKAKEKVTVTLNANGGTCASAEVSGFADETITLPTATKDGAVFAGWAESADATYNDAFIDITLTEAKTLYAVFVDYFRQVIYIDPKAEVDGDGKSVYSPLKAFDAAAIALSKDVDTTYVFMNSTCIDAFQDSAGSSATFTCVDPIFGTEYDSYVYYQGSNMGSPRLSRHFALDIPFAHARTDVDYICLNTRGYPTTFGANYFKPADGSTIPGTDLICKTGIDQIRGGGDGVNPANTALHFENLDTVNAAIRAGTQQGNVGGNVTVTVYSGSKDAEIGLGNDSNKSNTIGKNAVLKIYRYTEKATITATANIDSIGGGVYYILYNDAADNVTIVDNASAKAARGGYIIKTYGDGSVDVYDDRLSIFTYTSEVYINGVKQEITESGLYTIGEAGTYVITFDNLARNEVKYDLNGVEGTAPESYTAKENDEVVLPTLDIELEGMTFLGWNTDKDATTALGSLTMGKEAVTLYAIFKKAEYEVAFDSGIGKAVGELAPIVKVHGEDLTLPTDYVLYGTGLEFAGWSENPDATAEEVVTTYTDNEATTFFAIYNKVGTANVTPGTFDDELAEGTCFVIAESDTEVEAPEFDIPGTATEIAKVDITLMDATTGVAVQPASPVTFTIHCDEGTLEGKAVYVYHVCDEPEFVDATVNGDDVTFTTEHLSTFVVYTVEVDAQYKLVGQFNTVSGFYTINLYYNGKAANSGSFGFKYDADTFLGVEGQFKYADGIDAVVPTVYDDIECTFTGTWYPTEGAYIGGNDEDVLIGTFTFVSNESMIEATEPSERFYEFKPDAVIDEVYDGEYYLYAPNSASDLSVAFAPIVTMDVVDLEPITVTYKVTGNLVTVREDGIAPISYAKAIVTTENGTKVAEFAIENEATANGTVAFEFEMAPGAYNITVVKNGYLETTTSFNVTDGDLDIGEITPVPGDIRGNEADAQGDGKIDLADFVRVIRGFEYEELASHVDIDESGIVDVTDLGFVKANFNAVK